jgi:UDP-N-acetylmuramate dehydrogenase
MEVLEHFNLKNYNTFHVSASARYFVNVTDLNCLRDALDFAKSRNLPYLLIGQGSNLLFRNDYEGLIIEMNIRGKNLLAGDDTHWTVKARCGENWHTFVQWCLENSYYGLENLSLIPGTVGAAPVQNIGAYGVELCEVMTSLEALDIATGELLTFSNAECKFSYRHSVFKGELKEQYIITSVTFALHKQPLLKISYGSLAKALADIPEKDITPALVSRTVCDIRRSKLPSPGRIGNAGSFFWNPVIPQTLFNTLQKSFPDIVGYRDGDEVKLAAAWLIEQAGWKGHREGDVGVHKDHALVLVNYGQGSGAELVDLSERIQRSVHDKFGVQLLPEVRII